MTPREAIYYDNMRRSLAEVYKNIERHLELIPEEIDEDQLSDEQMDAVQAVECLEQEWILDPEQRAEMTCIKWQ